MPIGRDCRTELWSLVWLQQLHLQKQTPDLEISPLALCSGERFPQCTHNSHRNTADLQGHPLALLIQAKGIKSQTLIFISFLEGKTDLHTLAPLLPPAQSHIADGVSHRGGSITFHEGKVHIPHQATLQLKHTYQQPRATWHRERQLGNLLHQNPTVFLLPPLVFGGTGGTNIASSRTASRATMISVQADQCPRALCFLRK